VAVCFGVGTGNKHLQPGPDRIGAKYLKALYVEYTDASFTTRKVRRVSRHSKEACGDLRLHRRHLQDTQGGG
jgi:hypothetical protein